VNVYLSPLGASTLTLILIESLCIEATFPFLAVCIAPNPKGLGFGSKYRSLGIVGLGCRLS